MFSFSEDRSTAYYLQGEDLSPLRTQCFVLSLRLQTGVDQFQHTERIALSSEVCGY